MSDLHEEIISADEQFRNNAFALTKAPVWPHISLHYEGGYRLYACDYEPGTGDETLQVSLQTLLLAEAQWTDDTREGRYRGKRLAEAIRVRNAELDQRALWLEHAAAAVRRLKRPELQRTDAPPDVKRTGGLDVELLAKAMANEMEIDARSNRCRPPSDLADAVTRHYEYLAAGNPDVHDCGNKPLSSDTDRS